MKKLIFGAMLLFACTIQLSAQSSITGQAKAEVTSQLAITDNTGTPGGTTLNFGKIAVAAGSGGTCTVSTLNVVTVSGSVNAIVSTTSNAIFSLSGMAAKTYAITLPASTVVTRAGGVETMTVDNFKARPTSAGAEGLTGTLSSFGVDNFTVGGQLNVNAAQVDGIYNGTFSVTAAYN
ncbi:MAG: DUF4402 domain-containing protein [Paludibacter sp.]